MHCLISLESSSVSIFNGFPLARMRAIDKQHTRKVEQISLMLKKNKTHSVILLLVSTVFGVVGGLANWHLRRDGAEGN